MTVRYARHVPLIFLVMAAINLGMGLLLLLGAGEFHFSLIIGVILVVAAVLMWRGRMMVLHADRLGLQNPMGMELRRYRFDELRIEKTDQGRVLYGQPAGKRPKRLLAENGLTYDRAQGRALLDALAPRVAPGPA